MNIFNLLWFTTCITMFLPILLLAFYATIINHTTTTNSIAFTFTLLTQSNLSWFLKPILLINVCASGGRVVSC